MDEAQVFKRTLKKWELSFFKDHGRKPQRADIDESPVEIKEAYGKYSKLKKEQLASSKGEDELENASKKEVSSENKNIIDGHTGSEKCEKTTNEMDSTSEVWGREFDKKIVGDKVQQARHEQEVQDLSSSYLQGLSSKLYQNAMKFGQKADKKLKPDKKDNSWRKVCKPEVLTQSNSRKVCDGNDDQSLRVKGSMFEKALSFTQKKHPLKKMCSDEVLVTDKYNVKSKSKFSISLGQKYTKSFSHSDNNMDEVDLLDSNDKVFENKAYPCDSNNVICPVVKDQPTELDHGDKERPVVEGCISEKTGSPSPVEHSKDQNVINSMKKKTDSYEDLAPIKTRGKRVSRLKSPLNDKQQDDVEKKTECEKRKSPILKTDTESATGSIDVSSEVKKIKDLNFHPFDFDEKDEEIMKEDIREDLHNAVEKRKGGKKRNAEETDDRPAKKRKNIYLENEPSNEASDDEDSSQKSAKRPRKKSTSAAPASVGNFVRLNMRVKTYKRKGKGMTGQQYKRFQWKQKMKARSKSFGNKCFKCGQEGHWSNKCPEQNKESYGGEEDKPPVLEEDFPTMKEAALMAKGVKITRESKRSKAKTSSAASSTEQVEEEFNMEDIDWDANIDPDAEIDEELEIQAGIVRSRREEQVVPTPLSPLVDGESCDSEVPGLLKEGLKKFGYDNFRLGQEKAISRILAGKSTLVVMSTGGGKSLCYQLPAYLYAKRSKAITLVISPLVSLMEDQISGLPPGVKGACLHTNMTPAQREGVLSSVKEGKVHFLLVSPEAVAGGGMTLLNNKANLPPLAFVCIDEAHCLSEWSHNFRPSYLRLTKVLREKFGVKCFLGLTATATKSTAVDVAKHLHICDFEEAVIRGPPVPNNLFLSVSRDDDRDQALIGLLQGERFSTCESIIVYCTRREQTERLATLIRTCLKDEKGLDSWDDEQKKKQKGRQKKYGFWDAESYHAGLSPAQRKKVQNAFMSGRLRVVVATVAFGMGLDKSDVRGVIHYNMPKSFEGYVQEIGRAGRDGQDSQCHLFLDSQGQDLAELRRHTHSNTVDYRTLKKFVQKVFYPCRCKQVFEMQNEDEPKDEVNQEDKRICPGHERALSVESIVMELDVKEEGISTLLCYLELHPNHWVENLVNVYSMCKIQCYGGPSQLQTTAKKCPPVAVAIAKAKKDGKTFSNNNSIEFPVVEISDCMGWDSGPVKRDLKLLSWEFTVIGPKRTGVLVEFSDLAFHFRSPGDLTDDEQDDVLQFLHERIQKQEKEELEQLEYLYQSLKSVSHKNYWMCSDSLDQVKNEKLRSILRDFFQDQELWERSTQNTTEQTVSNQELSQAVADIRQLISVHGHEHRFTGRAIARILHGIGSPCFPATTWGRNRRFWRVHMHVDFNLLIKIATQEIIKLR